MDVRQEDMRFLGVFGILRETVKLIYTRRRIFTQITLAFILPLYFLLFAYMEITNSFAAKIPQITTSKFHKFPNTLSSETIYYLLFSFAYLIFSIIFSLLSISTVAYTVACIYTARDVTFKHVMSIVPKVWKRLFLTFLCVSVSLFVISFVFTSLITRIFVKYGPYAIGPGTVMIILLFSIIFILGTMYLTIIWQLSNTISVLEESYGFKAMAKSKALMKGKRVVTAFILVLIGLPFGTSQLVLQYVIVKSVAVGVVIKGILGILCLLLLSVTLLLKLVADAVLYFVCKSYHRENIDELADVSTDYVPLKLANDNLQV